MTDEPPRKKRRTDDHKDHDRLSCIVHRDDFRLVTDCLTQGELLDLAYTATVVLMDIKRHLQNRCFTVKIYSQRITWEWQIFNPAVCQFKFVFSDDAFRDRKKTDFLSYRDDCYRLSRLADVRYTLQRNPGSGEFDTSLPLRPVALRFTDKEKTRAYSSIFDYVASSRITPASVRYLKIQGKLVSISFILKTFPNLVYLCAFVQRLRDDAEFSRLEESGRYARCLETCPAVTQNLEFYAMKHVFPFLTWKFNFETRTQRPVIQMKDESKTTYPALYSIDIASFLKDERITKKSSSELDEVVRIFSEFTFKEVLCLAHETKLDPKELMKFCMLPGGIHKKLMANARRVWIAKHNIYERVCALFGMDMSNPGSVKDDMERWSADAGSFYRRDRGRRLALFCFQSAFDPSVQRREQINKDRIIKWIRSLEWTV